MTRVSMNFFTVPTLTGRVLGGRCAAALRQLLRRTDKNLLQLSSFRP
jgi:hypothetical protein